MIFTDAENNTLLDAVYVSVKHGIPLSTYQWNLWLDFLATAQLGPDLGNADQWASLRSKAITVFQQKSQQMQQSK